MTWPLFDVTEWLSRLCDGFFVDVAEESGAEHELDYYTDPAPYAGPDVVWTNPYYTGYRTADGVVRVYRSDEKPPDIERTLKQVEQINRVVENLLSEDPHPIDVVSDYDAENAVVDEIVHQVSHKYTLSSLFELRNKSF